MSPQDNVIPPWQAQALAHDICSLARLPRYADETRRLLRTACFERIDSLSLTEQTARELRGLVRRASRCA